MTVPMKVLVDDHPLARRAVVSLLAEALPALELREAGSTGEAITTATGIQPNLVILDLRTPDRRCLASGAPAGVRRPRARTARLNWLTFVPPVTNEPTSSAPATLIRAVRGCVRGQWKALSPVMARPTISDWMASVPS